MKANLLARLSQLWSNIAGLTDNKFYGFRNGAIVEQPYYETTVTWTAGGSQTITHNLGVIPKRVSFELVITAATQGLAIGDIVEWGTQIYSNNQAWGPEVRKKTTTDFQIVIGTSGFMCWSATGSAGSLTNAQCNLRIKVWGY